jgi:hypothetical protein
MNNRIDELAKQAGLRVESWMTNPPKPFQILGSAEDFEKFANLIILECIASIDDGDGSMSSIVENTWRQICCTEIRSHFGIKK